jgi:hypothetical protein
MNYDSHTLTFEVGVNSGKKSWIWIDYREVTPTGSSYTLGAWTRAEISSVTISGGTITAQDNNGFFLADNAAVTVTLNNTTMADKRYSWCAYASDTSPTAETNPAGGYMLKGTPPFIVNGSALAADETTFGAGTCIMSLTDFTNNPEFNLPPLPAATVVASSGTVCAGSPVTFTATPLANSGTTTAMTYTWNLAGAAADPAPTTATTCTATLTNPGAYTYTVTVTNANGCSSASATGTIIVRANPTSLTVDSPTICYNTPATLTATAATATASATYTWYINGFSATPTTTSTYTTADLTTTTTYTVTVTEPEGAFLACSSAPSDPGMITVHDPFNAGTISSTGESICAGGTVTTISSATPTGGDGAYTYTWWVSADNGNTYALITDPAATATTYTPAASATAVAGTYVYMRQVQEGCSPTASTSTGSWTLHVAPNPQVTIASSETICWGNTPAPMTSSVTGGTAPDTYKWQYMDENQTSWTNVSAAMTDTWQPGALMTSTTYRLVTTYNLSGCTETNSNEVVKTVRGKFDPGTISASGETVCVGVTAAAITATAASGGDSAHTYQWTVSKSDGTTFTITGATATTYQPATTATAVAGTYVYIRWAMDGTCNTGTWNASAGTYVLVVNANPEVTDVSSSTICYNTPATLTATASNVTAAATYTWTIQDISSSPTTVSTYTLSSLTATTTYTVQITNDTGCTSTVSTPGTITVYEEFSAGTIASGEENICIGAPVTTITGGDASGGDKDYRYLWTVSKDGDAAATITETSATAVTYTPSSTATSATGTYVYRRMVQDGTCTTTTWTESAGSWVLKVAEGPTVTIASSQTICSGETPAAMTATPAGGSGNPASYTWQIQDGGGWTEVKTEGSAASSTYQPGALTATITTSYYIYQVATSYTVAGCNEAFATATITVYAPLDPGSITSATYASCYNEAGTVTQATLASGGDSAYTYTWYVLEPGTSTYAFIASSNNASYTPPEETAAGTYYYIRHVADGCNPSGSYSAGTITREVYANFNPGSITSVTYASCYGVAGTATTVATDGTASGGDGAYSYTWYASTDGSNYTLINDVAATATTYQPPATTTAGTYYYMRQVKDGMCNTSGSYSAGTITREVYKAFDAGTISNAGESICAGGSVTTITGVDASGGNEAKIEYQWKHNDEMDYIPSATEATYTPSGTYVDVGAHTFTRWVKDIDCQSTFIQSAGSWVLNVTTGPTVNIIASSETICSGETPAAMTATPAGGSGNPASYTWQIQNGGGWTEVKTEGSAASSTYQPGVLTATSTTDYIYQVATSYTVAGCSEALATATITVYAPLDPGSITSATYASCYNEAGTVTVATQASGGDSAYSYTWYASTDGSNYTLINDVAATATTYQPPATTTAGTYYYMRHVKDGKCNTAGSYSAGTITREVYADFNPGTIISATYASCYDEAGTVTVEANAASGGDSAYSYTWSVSTDGSNYTIIPGATASTYEPPATTTAGTYYYMRQVKDGMCNTSGSYSAGTITREVYADFNPGTIISATYVTCNGDAGTVTIEDIPASGGDGAYSYTWYASFGGSQYAIIPGATATTYEPPATTTAGTYYYMRHVVDGRCNTAGSYSAGTITREVYADFSPGTISASGQTVCVGVTAAAIISVADASGGDSAHTYQWTVSYNSGSAATITETSATAVTYTPSSTATDVAGTYVYIRWAMDGTCSTWNASAGTYELVVNENPVVNSVTSPTICYGTTAALTATASGTTTAAIYTWTIQDITPSATTTVSTYTTASALSVTATYTVQITNDTGCTSTVSTPGTITVYDKFDPGTITSATYESCYNTAGTVTTVAGDPSGGDGAYSYTWSVSTDGSSYTLINGAAATASTYQPPVITTAGTYYYMRQVKDGTCNTYTYSAGTITREVYEQFDPGTITQGAQTVCHNATTVLTITNSVNAKGGEAPIEYKWQCNGTDISVDAAEYSSSTHNIAVSASSVYTFTRWAKDNASKCSSDWTPSVGTYTLTVNPLPDVPTTASSYEICSGETATFSANVSIGEDIDWYDVLTGGSQTYTGGTYLLSTSTFTGSAQTYTFYAEARNTMTGCVSESRLEVSAIVHPLPVPSFVSPPATVCSNSMATFTADGAGSGGSYCFTYECEQCLRNPFLTGTGDKAAVDCRWSSTCSPSTAATYMVVVPDEGSMTVTVTVTTVKGCESSTTTVVAIDKVSISPMAASTTPGADVLLTASPASATYQWTPGNETTQDKTVSAPAAGTTEYHTVKVTTTNGCIVEATASVTGTP